MRRAELAASLGGCVLVVAALVIIWVARLSIPRALYAIGIAVAIGVVGLGVWALSRVRILKP